MLKLGAFLGLMLAFGAWISGALNFGYSRTVQRPQAEVMAALEDLDITAQPGAPGTDPSVGRREAAVPSRQGPERDDLVRDERRSGCDPHDRQLRAAEQWRRDPRHHQRGARRRTRRPRLPRLPLARLITRGLFSMAVEGELNKPDRARAITKTADECQDIFVRDMAGAGMKMDEASRHGSLSQAIGAGAMTSMRMARDPRPHAPGRLRRRWRSSRGSSRSRTRCARP